MPGLFCQGETLQRVRGTFPAKSPEPGRSDLLSMRFPGGREKKMTAFHDPIKAQEFRTRI